MAQVELNDPIYRTTPERTTKMMVIMLGICIAGGGIFFGMWDYWISMPPPAGLCLLYTSPSPRDKRQSRMPSSA